MALPPIGISGALLDALLFIRDGDNAVAAELIRYALDRLGINAAAVELFLHNHPSAK